MTDLVPPSYNVSQHPDDLVDAQIFVDVESTRTSGSIMLHDQVNKENLVATGVGPLCSACWGLFAIPFALWMPEHFELHPNSKFVTHINTCMNLCLRINCLLQLFSLLLTKQG